MRPAALLAALLAFAAPARADLAADYAAAVRAFALPGAPVGPTDPVEGEAAWVALLPTLEGTWAGGLEVVAMGRPDLPPDDVLARHCERQGARLSATGPRGFELSLPFETAAGPDALVQRFDFLLLNTFQRSVDEGAWLRRILPDPEDPRYASVRTSALVAIPRGEVLLFHPSPDLLVVAQPGRPAEFWRRCP